MSQSTRPGIRQALGKGIGALIPGGNSRLPAETDLREPEDVNEGARRVHELPLESIEVNPRQPRGHFEQEMLEDLARSIRERGVIQPVLVRPLEDGRYQLVAGERRLRASRLAGAATIPALVQDLDDDESLVIALVENSQRADLGPLEEARAFQSLIEEFDLTQDEVARRVGRSRPAVANSLRLLKLPESVQKDLAAGRLTAGHARALLTVEGDAARKNLGEEIVRRGLNVRDTENAAREHGPAPRAARVDPDLARMETDLGRSLGTRVRLRTQSGGRGRIEIEFYSDDDLARLVELLRRGG